MKNDELEKLDSNELKKFIITSDYKGKEFKKKVLEILIKRAVTEKSKPYGYVPTSTLF
jgi:hypothetical protein